MSAYVFHFGGGATNNDPRSRDKTITGGKGANLAEMAGIGLPVPPGFTHMPEGCTAYHAVGKAIEEHLRLVVPVVVAQIAAATGAVFVAASHSPLRPCGRGRAWPC